MVYNYPFIYHLKQAGAENSGSNDGAKQFERDSDLYSRDSTTGVGWTEGTGFSGSILSLAGRDGGCSRACCIWIASSVEENVVNKVDYTIRSEDIGVGDFSRRIARSDPGSGGVSGEREGLSASSSDVVSVGDLWSVESGTARNLFCQ